MRKSAVLIFTDSRLGTHFEENPQNAPTNYSELKLLLRCSKTLRTMFFIIAEMCNFDVCDCLKNKAKT